MLSSVLGNMKSFINIYIYEGWGETVCAGSNYRTLQSSLYSGAVLWVYTLLVAGILGRCEKVIRPEWIVCVCVCIIWGENKLSFERCTLYTTMYKHLSLSTQYCNCLLI